MCIYIYIHTHTHIHTYQIPVGDTEHISNMYIYKWQIFRNSLNFLTMFFPYFSVSVSIHRNNLQNTGYNVRGILVNSFFYSVSI